MDYIFFNTGRFQLNKQGVNLKLLLFTPSIYRIRSPKYRLSNILMLYSH